MAPHPKGWTIFSTALLTTHLLNSVVVNATCYYPNGNPRGKDPWGGEYKPCNTDGTGMCCALGRPEGSEYFNYCFENGLCYENGTGMTWRESCSDPTWSAASGCLNLCVTDFDGKDSVMLILGFVANILLLVGGSSSDDVKMTFCNDKTWCCGPDSAACCDAGKGVQLGGNIIMATSTVATSSSSFYAAQSTSMSYLSTTTVTGSYHAAQSTSISYLSTTTVTGSYPCSEVYISGLCSTSDVSSADSTLVVISCTEEPDFVWCSTRYAQTSYPLSTPAVQGALKLKSITNAQVGGGLAFAFALPAMLLLIIAVVKNRKRK